MISAAEIPTEFTCDRCSYRGSSKATLYAHKKVHAEKKLRCDLCDYKTQFRRNLTLHNRTHSGEKPFICEFSDCNYSSSQAPNLAQHILLIHSSGKPFPCKICSESFKSKHLLNAHVIAKHKGKRPHQCLYDGCEFSSTRVETLKTHVLTHTGERPFRCYFNNCEYASTHSLTVHIRTHTGERPSRCGFKGCGYSSARFDDMERHSLTHSGQKPHRCNFENCGFASARESSLKNHLLRHLVRNEPSASAKISFESIQNNRSTKSRKSNRKSSPVAKHSCKICEFKTRKLKKYDTHVQSHRDKGLLNCLMCDFVTLKQKRFEKHVITHETNTRYEYNFSKQNYVTPETVTNQNGSCNNGNSSLPEETVKAVAISGTVIQPAESATEEDQPKHKRLKLNHNFNNNPELQEESNCKKRTKIQSSPQLESLMTKTNFHPTPSMKNKWPNLATIKTEKESPFKPVEGISSTNVESGLENIDCTHSVLQVKVEQCKKYSCRVCDFGTKKKRKYVDHVELHKKEGHLFCSLCDFVSLNGKRFKKHFRSHKNDLHETETNNSILNNGPISEVQLTSPSTSLVLDVPPLFSNSHFLPRSRKDETAVEESVPLQLSECDGKLLKMKEKETSVGDKRFSCSACDYKTQYKHNLTGHTRIHTGDRPFTCTYNGCSYSSSQKSTLSTHFLLRHSSEKPYSCQLCGERFRNRQFLNSHVRNHKGKRPICCQYKGCEFSCTLASDLKRHILTHTGDKPYHCDFEGCGFSCNRDSVLKRHIGTHTGYRPHPCTFKGCSHSFRDACDLKTHILTHTGAKPFHCDFNDCKFSAAQSGNLKAHMLRHLTQNPHACPECKFRSRTPLEIKQHLEIHHKLQNTSKSKFEREEESSAGVEVIEAISSTQTQLVRVNNDLPQFVSQVKLKPRKTYSCPICEFGTKKKSKYKGHIELHQKEGYLFCTLCDFASVNKKHFKKHLRTHENDSCDGNNNSKIRNNSCFKVPLIRQEALSDTSSTFLNSHSLPLSDEVDVDESAAAMQPPEYGSKLLTMKDRDTSGEKKCFCCSVCDFKTQYKANLARHAQIHTGVKPFACTYSGCNYSSRHKRDLALHFLVRHSKEKPYLCQLCGDAFKGKHRLNSHILNHRGKRPYCCLYKGCEYSSTNSGHLKEHIRTHTKEKPYHCYFEGCGYSGTTISSLNGHIRTHTGERPYPCHFKDCNYSASNTRNLKNHISTHTGVKPFHCDFKDCKFSCSQSGHLKEHMLRHLTEAPHTFPECKFRSRTPLEIEQHLDTHLTPQNTSKSSHLQPNAPIRESPAKSVTNILRAQAQPSLSSQNNNETHSKTQDAAGPRKKYVCPICDFESKSKKKYNAHLDSHGQKNTNETLEVSFTSPNGLSNENLSQTDYDSKLPTMEEKGTSDEQTCFQRSVCDYKTQYKHHLTDHARIHTGDRPFSCTYSGCNYSAAQKGNVMTHFVLIHSKEMPYACHLCGEAFRNRQFLNSHVRNHKGKRPICCQYKGCEFSSFLSYDLKRHIRSHTLEKPHHCDFEGCDFSCSRKFTLKAHLLTHTGGRPYRCTFKNCNFSAIHSSNLKTHSFIHTKVKPFRCDFSDCEFSCAQSGHLKLHIMQHLSQTPHACPHCKFRSRTLLEIEQHLETHHKLQNTSPSWGQPDAKIRESPAEATTNIMREKIQPPFISQNNNEKDFKTRDEARPSKKYVCLRCDFESKSHKKYKAHLNSHLNKKQFLETRDTKLAKRKINSKQGSNISSNRSQGKENGIALLRETKKSLASFPCNFCKKSFDKEMKLLNHLRYHTGQKMPRLESHD